MSRFNATTYLEGHGWRGKGVPLDGEQGRGLKKPLALPQKRNVKGLGKERDRATEWWDSLFEASAKKLQAPSMPATAASGAAAATAAARKGQTPSLMALAKREHAKKQLMSGFVRGRPNKEYEDKMRELDRVLAEQQSAKQSMESAPAASDSEAASPTVAKDAKLSKEERRAARRERKLRKTESTLASNEERKKERKKRRREDESTSSSAKKKKLRERTAEEGTGGVVTCSEVNDKARRKEEKRRSKKKVEKVKIAGKEEHDEPLAFDAKKALKKRKE